MCHFAEEVINVYFNVYLLRGPDANDGGPLNMKFVRYGRCPNEVAYHFVCFDFIHLTLKSRMFAGISAPFGHRLRGVKNFVPPYIFVSCH